MAGIISEATKRRKQKEYSRYVAETLGRQVKDRRQKEMLRQEEVSLQQTLKYFDKRKPRSQAEANFIANKIFAANFRQVK